MTPMNSMVVTLHAPDDLPIYRDRDPNAPRRVGQLAPDPCETCDHDIREEWEQEEAPC